MKAQLETAALILVMTLICLVTRPPCSVRVMFLPDVSFYRVMILTASLPNTVGDGSIIHHPFID